MQVPFAAPGESQALVAGQRARVVRFAGQFQVARRRVQLGRQPRQQSLDAGFDGVELHAASGYLPEQFLASGSNGRQDQYGGSVENRARFIVEVLTAMVAEAGADRVGIKISPEMNYNSISDADPASTYRYLIGKIGSMGLAYLHGGGLTRESAAALLEEGKADAVVFGAAFLANPDLPQRFRDGATLNAPDHGTFFAPPTAHGYIDYPTLD